MVRQYRDIEEVYEDEAVRLVFETGKPITQEARDPCVDEGTLGRVAAAGDVPTSPGDRGVHRTVQSINPASAPTDCRPVRIAAQLPATEQSVDRLPAAVPLRPVRRTARESGVGRSRSPTATRSGRVMAGRRLLECPPRILRGELRPYPPLVPLLKAARNRA
jgi:hypothetical protein